jgi:hypothetical protein
MAVSSANAAGSAWMHKVANNRHELPARLRQRLVELGHRMGLRALATTIGVSPQALASVAAGLRVHTATVALVELRLAELDRDTRASEQPGAPEPSDD